MIVKYSIKELMSCAYKAVIRLTDEGQHKILFKYFPTIFSWQSEYHYYLISGGIAMRSEVYVNSTTPITNESYVIIDFDQILFSEPLPIELLSFPEEGHCMSTDIRLQEYLRVRCRQIRNSVPVRLKAEGDNGMAWRSNGSFWFIKSNSHRPFIDFRLIEKFLPNNISERVQTVPTLNKPLIKEYTPGGYVRITKNGSYNGIRYEIGETAQILDYQDTFVDVQYDSHVIRLYTTNWIRSAECEWVGMNNPNEMSDRYHGGDMTSKQLMDRYEEYGHLISWDHALKAPSDPRTRLYGMGAIPGEAKVKWNHDPSKIQPLSESARRHVNMLQKHMENIASMCRYGTSSLEDEIEEGSLGNNISKVKPIKQDLFIQDEESTKYF